MYQIYWTSCQKWALFCIIGTSSFIAGEMNFLSDVAYIAQNRWRTHLNCVSSLHRTFRDFFDGSATVDSVCKSPNSIPIRKIRQAEVMILWTNDVVDWYPLFVYGWFVPWTLLLLSSLNKECFFVVSILACGSVLINKTKDERMWEIEVDNVFVFFSPDMTVIVKW